MPNVACVVTGVMIACTVVSCSTGTPSKDTTSTAVAAPGDTTGTGQLMTPADLDTATSDPPDARIAYGPTVPDRYAQVSPKSLLPLGVPQVVVIGTFEDFVPRPIVEAYITAAVQAGDSARMIFIPKAGHFEIASTNSFAWPKIEGAIQTILDGKLPPPD